MDMADSDLEMEDNYLLEILRESNIYEAAYKEVILKAQEAGMVGIELSPALGSLEASNEIVFNPLQYTTRVECSIKTAIFPVQSNDMVSMLMDVDAWAISFPELIYRASAKDLTAVFRQLEASDGNENRNIVAVKMVDAEVSVPAHLVGPRVFYFLRFQREIKKDTWAIFDISLEYFLSYPYSISNYLRRSSGVIIMAHENNSEVVWIENVEVCELPLVNIYSKLLTSSIAFSAMHWVSIFSHRMHRSKHSKIWVKDETGVKDTVMGNMRDLSDRMKKLFSQSVHELPEDQGFTVLSKKQGIWILKDATEHYFGVTSFRVNSKPKSVLECVMKKDMKLEWVTRPTLSQKLIEQTTEEPYNRITLYGEKSCSTFDPKQISQSILQEVSGDPFCSCVISAPLNHISWYNIFCSGQPSRSPTMHPTDFSIMPDGSGGLHSDTSLVSFALYNQFKGKEVDIIKSMIGLVTTTKKDVERDQMDEKYLRQILGASNIYEAAYTEVILKAQVAGMVGIELSPALDSFEESKEIMFNSPPGMKVECSIETAIFSVLSNNLASMMMDVDTWATLFPELIYRASADDLTAVFKELEASDGNGNGNIAAVKMVTVEVRLPSHLVETRKFRFLKFQREIIKDTWAIFDISLDLLPNKPYDFISKRMCLRRPSGVIIRARENNSEVVWIENVVVYELPLENNIYSTLLNSNIVFSAKHWVSTFSRRMHRRIDSEIWVKDDIKVKDTVMGDLEDLCDDMKKIFSECVHECPDEESFSILSDEQGIRILKDATVNYIGVTSFRVNFKPISVLDYVSQKDMALEWSASTSPKTNQIVIKQTTEEPFNCLTLYGEESWSTFDPNMISKSVLQEVSRNHFCSYVISAPLTKFNGYELLSLGQQISSPIYPTGFAIMPDGSRGLYSKASLVTFVVHRPFAPCIEETQSAIDTMIRLVTATRGDVEKYGNHSKF